MSSAEQMEQWRSAVDSTRAVPQTAGTTISTTGVGTFNQPDAFMFGYSFVNQPVMTYGAQLDNYDPTNPRAIISQGYTYQWIIDDQGLYIGAYIGVRIIDAAPGAQANHHFHFRELAVKNILFTPNIPASYAIGTATAPAPADGTLLNVSTIDSSPIVAPTVSPSITAYALPDSIVLKADTVSPTTEIEYHVSTSTFTPVQGNAATLVKRTRSMVEVVSALPNGSLLQLDTGYYFHAIAVNSAGSAAPSAEVVATLDPSAVATIVASQIVAGFVLAGLIKVGSITIDPNSGIQIPILPTVTYPDGGLISLPADGSPAQFIRVLLEATSLVVYDNFQLRGTSNQISGTLGLAPGVVTPTVGPTVLAAWDDPSIKFTTANFGYGLADDGTNWVTVSGSVVGYNKSTGAQTTLLSDPDRDAYSVCKSGTKWYVLMLNVFTDLMEVREYDASWNYTGTNFTPSAVTGCDHPTAISSDGSTLYLAYHRDLSDTKIVVRSMTTSGGSATTVFTTADTFASFSNMWVGSADFASSGGSTRRFILSMGTSLRVINNAGTRVTGEEWSNPNSETTTGVYYDGANFRVMTAGSHVWKMSPIITSTARSVRWSQFDSVGTQHETVWSPTTPFTHLPRRWMKISTPAPQNSGGADDPNSIRHYIQNGGSGSYYLQADVTAAPWTAYYGTPSTSTAGPSVLPDFTGITPPGVLQSASGLSYVKGDDSWALKGLTDSWIAYTPVLTATGSNPALGTGGTIQGWYQLVGKTVRVRTEITFGTTGLSAGSGTYLVTLPPFTPARSSNSILGNVLVRDSSVPTSVVRFVNLASTTTARYLDVSGTTLTNSNVFTWASGDSINAQFEYETT